MTATSHAITGAVIGMTINQPIVAIALAFLSHFILDAVPHFDFAAGGKEVLERNKDRTFLTFLLADTIVLLIFVSSLFLLIDSSSLYLVIACVFAAISPDLVWGWRFINEQRTNQIKPLSWFSKMHLKVQWKEFPKGLIVEVIFILIMASILGITIGIST